MQLNEVIDDIYGEIVDPVENRSIPEDTVVYDVAMCLRVRFVIDIRYTNGTAEVTDITEAHLREWGITTTQLVEIAGEGGGQTPVQAWPRLHGNTKAYSYPTLDSDWVAHLLAPRRLCNLELIGSPLVVVPSHETFLVTGDEDMSGQKYVFRECRRLTDHPTTRRPLVLNSITGQWEILADKKNVLARKYRWSFGATET